LDKLLHLDLLSSKRNIITQQYGLYILDRELMKDTKIASSLSFLCNNVPAAHEQFLKSSCNHAAKQLSFDVWHKRVGHIPYKRMKLLPIDIDFSDLQQDVPCDICPKAKQQRLPFQLSTISSTSAFELIHVDTWGPYHTKNHSGHRFFF